MIPLDIGKPLTTHDVGEACKKAIEGNPTADLRTLVGRVMSDLHGRANPALVTEELKRLKESHG